MDDLLKSQSLNSLEVVTKTLQEQFRSIVQTIETKSNEEMNTDQLMKIMDSPTLDTASNEDDDAAANLAREFKAYNEEKEREEQHEREARLLQESPENEQVVTEPNPPLDPASFKSKYLQQSEDEKFLIDTLKNEIVQNNKKITELQATNEQLLKDQLEKASRFRPTQTQNLKEMYENKLAEQLEL